MPFARALAPLAACFLLMIAGSAGAQTTNGALHRAIGAPGDFKLSGSIRARYEGLTGQFRPGFDGEDDLISFRTTLFAEYDAGAVRIGAELYDSRAYAGDPGSVVGANDVNAFELVQAYVAADADDLLGDGSRAGVQAGRFVLNLGSRRLVAADDYRNTTNGYTGLRFDLSSPRGLAATFIYVLPQIRLPDDLPSILDNEVRFDRESFDLRLWGGVAAQSLGDGTIAELSYYRLQERDSPGRPTRDRNLHSVGLRAARESRPGALDFEAEAIYQFGTIRSGLAATAPRLDVSAGFLHLDAGYSVPGSDRARLSIEYDWASGDGPGRRFGRFDTLFGMRRADFGPAGIYAAIGRANIRTIGLRLEAAPGPRTDGFFTARALWAAAPTDSFSTTGVRDPTGASGRFAGYQVEGRLRRWLVPNRVRAEANAAWLIKRGLLRSAPNAPDTGDTLYVSLATILNF